MKDVLADQAGNGVEDDKKNTYTKNASKGRTVVQ
jgi:hypothetical protein